VDFRLRQSDFSDDGKMAGIPWLGMPIAELTGLDRVLVVGSALRKEHPLIAHRLRQGTKKNLQLSILNPFDDELLMRVAHNAIVPPGSMARALAEAVKAVAGVKNAALPESVRSAIGGVEPGVATEKFARDFAAGERTAILLGNLAQHHPHAATLRLLAQAFGEVTGARVGVLGEAANSVGGYIAGATPLGSPAGKNTAAMLAEPLKAYILLGVEAELDTHDPVRALNALRQAELVVALSPYEHRAVEYAHVMLPIGPFTETAGTFINMEGRVQSFNGCVQPLGETRPAWKVLRVLANLLGLPGFEQDTAEAVRREALGAVVVSEKLDNRIEGGTLTTLPRAPEGLQRIGEVPIYAADAIVRRSPPLQKTRDAAPPVAWMSGALYERLGLRPDDFLKVRQGEGEAVVAAAVDVGVPDGCIRLAAARPETAELGAMFGVVTAERVAAQQKMAV
jgi:NADH-quinone oxidoreductase subunit G